MSDSLKTCPGCQNKVPEERDACPFCGVIFSKWHGHVAGHSAPLEFGKLTLKSRRERLVYMVYLIIIFGAGLIFYSLQDYITERDERPFKDFCQEASDRALQGSEVRELEAKASVKGFEVTKKVDYFIRGRAFGSLSLYFIGEYGSVCSCRFKYEDDVRIVKMTELSCYSGMGKFSGSWLVLAMSVVFICIVTAMLLIAGRLINRFAK
jgi:hypothetical protein